MLIVTLGFGSVTWISNLLMEVDGGWSFLSWFELYINHNTNALSFRYVSPTLLIIIIGAMTLGCVSLVYVQVDGRGGAFICNGRGFDCLVM